MANMPTASTLIKGGIVATSLIFHQQIYQHSQDFFAQWNSGRILKQQQHLLELETQNSVSVISDNQMGQFSHEQQQNEKQFYSMNLDYQLRQLQNHRLIAFKGPYGSGSTYQSLLLGSQWKANNDSQVLYFRPTLLHHQSITQTFFGQIQCKDQFQFLSVLKKLKSNNQELLLIFDNIDILDFQDPSVKSFFQFLHDLHDQKLLKQLYIIKSNMAEKNLQSIYENSINMNFLGKGIFMEHQTQFDIQFVKNQINSCDDQTAKKLLFFFGVNHKIMQDLNSFVKFNQQINDLQLNIDDFIDIKVDRMVHKIQENNNSKEVLKICKYIDSGSGIFISNWKKALSYEDVDKLENDDILQIQGTTNALTRAAIAKICKQNWRNWNLHDWKGHKFNVDYNI